MRELQDKKRTLESQIATLPSKEEEPLEGSSISILERKLDPAPALAKGITSIGTKKDLAKRKGSRPIGMRGGGKNTEAIQELLKQIEQCVKIDQFEKL